jgi:5-formyltetrahydrofolate cyclo-ligase
MDVLVLGMSYDREMSSSKQGPSGSSKDELRRKIAVARDGISPEEAGRLSALIRRRVIEVPEVRSATCVFIYLSYLREVDTHALIEDLLRRKKTVAVPLITGEGVMEAHRIAGLEDLSPGKFGILAPRAMAPCPGPLEVVIAPGIAFTARGDRLGRGKGFYDRFLAAHAGSFAIGLGYEVQIVEEIPITPTDHRMDMVITEKRTIRAAR